MDDSALSLVERKPAAILRWARFMKHRSQSTILLQDDREHCQTAELDDTMMSDELIFVGIRSPILSTQTNVAGAKKICLLHPLYLFFYLHSQCIDLQGPHGPLNIG